MSKSSQVTHSIEKWPILGKRLKQFGADLVLDAHVLLEVIHVGEARLADVAALLDGGLVLDLMVASGGKQVGAALLAVAADRAAIGTLHYAQKRSPARATAA